MTTRLEEIEGRQEDRCARVSEVRYCEDCRFYAKAANGMGYGYAQCSKPYPVIKPIELVARAAETPIRFCENTRENPSACGFDAKWFEPKVAEAAE